MTQVASATTETPAAPPPDPEASEAAELAAIMAEAKGVEPEKPAPAKTEPEKPKPEDVAKADTSPRAFIGLKKKERALAAREAEITAKAAEAEKASARLHELAKTDKLAALRELGIDPDDLHSLLVANALSDKPSLSEADKPVTKRELEALRAEHATQLANAQAQQTHAAAARAFLAGVAADTEATMVHAWVDLQGDEGQELLVAAADKICDDVHARTGKWPSAPELHAYLNAAAKVDLEREYARSQKIQAALGHGAPISGKANGAAATRAPAGNGSRIPGGTLSHGALASAPPDGETPEEEEARLLALIRNGK